MKLFTLIFGLVVLISAVLAVPTALDAGADHPYPLVPFQYDGELGGKHVNLTGSADQIIAQFNKLYPELAFDTTDLTTRYYDEQHDDLFLSKRNKAPPALCCNHIAQPWSYVSDKAIRSAVGILSMFGRCVVQPRTCIRLSCGFQNAGIFICNDRFYTINPSCGYMGSYATDTVRDCSSGGNSCGQLFDTDGYNIITRKDTSCTIGIVGGGEN